MTNIANNIFVDIKATYYSFSYPHKKYKIKRNKEENGRKYVMLI